jgi:hypothetical protein
MITSNSTGLLWCTDESDQGKLIQDLTNLYSSSIKLATVATRLEDSDQNKAKIPNSDASAKRQVARTTEQAEESICDGGQEVAKEKECNEEEYDD